MTISQFKNLKYLNLGVGKLWIHLSGWPAFFSWMLGFGCKTVVTNSKAKIYENVSSKELPAWLSFQKSLKSIWISEKDYHKFFHLSFCTLINFVTNLKYFSNIANLTICFVLEKLGFPNPGNISNETKYSVHLWLNDWFQVVAF